MNEKTKNNLRIVALMFLVFVATYQFSIGTVCDITNNVTLTSKDRFSIFAKCIPIVNESTDYFIPTYYSSNFTLNITI